MLHKATGSTERKSPWNLLALPFLVGCTVGLVLLAYIGMNRLQHALAPGDTLLITRPRWISLLTFLPWVFPGIGPGFWLFNFFTHHIPLLRRAIEPGSPARERRRYREGQQAMRRYTLVAASGALCCMLLGAGTFTSVGPTGLQHHPFPGLSTRLYRWDDITAVHATCTRYYGGKGSPTLNLHYDTTMKDGATIDLLGDDETAFPAVYAVLRSTLVAHPTIRRTAEVTPTGLSWPIRKWGKPAGLKMGFSSAGSSSVI